MEKAVTVLTPNGRRQTVKVNLNATILQILEEVCKKHGLKPEDYNIKHHNKCLDTSTIIRFSGLPNNAQLELSEALTQREDGIVTLGIQLENGTRLTESFSPTISLHQVLNTLCPDEMSPDTNPVVIYMRREIYGENSFKDTTLRTLGLTSGRAMLRLIHRSPEELRVQANVSAPLPSRPVEEQPYIRTFKKLELPENLPHAETAQDEPSKRNFSENRDDVVPPVKDKKQKHVEAGFGKRALDAPTLKESPKMYVKTVPKENTVAEENFVFLGARNAMVFSQETAEAIPTAELPDDFFELTITDAKKLLKDIKKRRLELENAPLQTSTLRSLFRSTQELSQLNRYKQSVIRIHFPDQTVLQGVFKPLDTVETVVHFVEEYLENRAMEFYLYTTPPKEILNTNSKLVEIGCVPNAVLHFGTKDLAKDGLYLRLDLVNKFTTASVASLAAAKMRQESTRPPPRTFNDDEMSLSDFPLEDNAGAGTSSGKFGYEDYPRKTSTSPDKKMPKWFKQPK